MAKKINICIIGPDSIHTKRWANWFLNSKYYNVTTLLYPTYKNPFQYVFAIKKILFNYLKIRKKQDITHIHYIGTFAYILTPFVKKNLVLSAWGSDVLISPKKYKVWNFLLKKCLKKSTKILTDGQHIISMLLKYYGISDEKIFLSLYGTDVNKYSPKNKNKIDIKKKYPGYNNFIISLRNLEPVYGINTLVMAAEEVVKQDSKTLFLIFGNGTLKEGLENKTKQLNLERNILFCGGYSQEYMQKILPNMDIYVSTALSDAGLAASTAEAMASGVISIVTDFGDNKNWVKDGVTGYLFPLKGKKELSEKIKYFIDNKENLNNIRKNARKMIVNNLNYEKEMNKISSLYLELYRANKK